MMQSINTKSQTHKNSGQNFNSVT